MKIAKKILYTTLLSSCIMLFSINVFAKGGGAAVEPTTSGCVDLVIETATTESAQEYRETVTHYGDFGNESLGDEVPWTDPGPDPTREDTDGDGEPNIEYRVITNYNTDWVTDEYDCDIYIVGNTSYFT